MCSKHNGWLIIECSFFRSRPVVRVSAEVQLESGDEPSDDSKGTGGVIIIDAENRTCSLASGIKVACLTIKGCLLYEGEAVGDELGMYFIMPLLMGYYC